MLLMIALYMRDTYLARMACPKHPRHKHFSLFLRHAFTTIWTGRHSVHWERHCDGGIALDRLIGPERALVCRAILPPLSFKQSACNYRGKFSWTEHLENSGIYHFTEHTIGYLAAMPAPRCRRSCTGILGTTVGRGVYLFLHPAKFTFLQI